jgi:hypothetical protein
LKEALSFFANAFWRLSPFPCERLLPEKLEGMRANLREQIANQKAHSSKFLVLHGFPGLDKACCHINGRSHLDGWRTRSQGLGSIASIPFILADEKAF